jgi:D-alanine--poly(phosphoribitol) ligase subunit 1
MNFNLASPFYEQARAQPENLALRVSGKAYSYGELAALTGRAAAALGDARKVGVLASRTLGAYVGILASSWSGAAYIPLSPTKLPDERLAAILEIIRPDALIVDSAGLARMTPALRAIAPPLILDLSGQFNLLPELNSLTKERVEAPSLRGADDLAYVIFTSGTTGVAKGVVIKLGSIAQFLEAMRVRIKPVSADRISQTSELSFDVSVFEMFLAWGSGASVYVVPATQLMSPSHFITDHGLTIWSSVPSIAAFMRGVKTLKPGAFPSLRYSVFCGEALPYPLAEAWQAAAPSSIVENLYGPTEATVGCVSATAGSEFPATPTLNLVPSGLPLPGVEAAVVDESLAFLPVGEVGQLVIAGGQLAEGYYNEPELTRERFPTIDGKRWYLTGDLTRQDEHGAFHHLGRMDRQIKLMGQRVELEEIEAHLRSVSNSDNVAAVAWPIEDGLVQGVVGFTSGVSASPQELLDLLRRRLPLYMVPRRIVQLDELPHTSSGKIDRNALVLSLNESPSLYEEAS